MHKSVIIDGPESNDKLNELFANGWDFVSACPMPSSAGIAAGSVTEQSFEFGKVHLRPTCLVIVQKQAN